MKKIASFFFAAVLCLSLAACGGSDSSTNPSDGASEDLSSVEETTKAPETAEEFYAAMIARSLYSLGNSGRLEKKLEDAQNGTKITVGFLGGSITEGLNAGDDACYAKLTYDYISKNYGNGDNVEYCNAGMSGTPSTLGAIRADRDLLAYSPDIVFIEFAVNDGMDGDYQDGFESLIRTVLSQENEPAVVIILNRLENGYTAQENMKKIGDYYQLPIVSVADGLTPEFDEGRMVWTDYSNDQSHPHVEGHALVAEMICNLLETASENTASEDSWTMPSETYYSAFLQNCHIYENTTLEPTSLGGFEVGSTLSRWTNGWSHKKDGGSEPIEFDITAKSLYIVYKTHSSGNLGTIEVKVECDGEEPVYYTIDGITSDGWGNPSYRRLKLGGATDDYHITISMAEGSEEKVFEILAFGYTL